MERVDIAIIGAGVVGLAVAAELSANAQVAVLERRESYGLETSSHNSGVVHAGIYYPPDWLKTTLCVEGNRLLYEWAERYGVRYQRCGKLIIAIDDEEVPRLRELYNAAQRNGVSELRLIEARGELAALEPSVTAVAAIFSGTSGVVDQMELMRSFTRVAEANGAMVAYKHELLSAARGGESFVLEVAGPDGERFEMEASVLVNSAGLFADRVAAMLGYPLDGGEGAPRLRQAINKGRYYDIVNAPQAGRLRHLVYPLPYADRAGLGVHVTLDVDGGVHLGPDTEWLDEGAPLDYRADDRRRETFVESARRYLPWLEADDIMPGQVGYRPKLSGPGEPPADFLIWHDRGYLHLGGIESPGMTAALAIAKRITAELRRGDVVERAR